MDLSQTDNELIDIGGNEIDSTGNPTTSPKKPEQKFNNNINIISAEKTGLKRAAGEGMCSFTYTLKQFAGNKVSFYFKNSYYFFSR